MQRTPPDTHKLLLAGLLAAALLPLLSGCSIKRLAVNQVGNALAGSGSTFASDDDPDLVKAAVPFSLKLMESVLAENPNHRELLLASASGFTQFAFAFVQQDADELEDSDLAAAEKLHTRARRLYVRGRNYGLRGLELAHPGFEKNLRADPKTTLQAARAKDVPLLYWTATAWAASISLSKDNPDMLADLPFPEALIDRALVLDESFGDGAIHSFLVTYEMSRPNASTNAEARSRQHFDRAMQLSGGLQAGPLVALAEAVSVQKQDLKEFESLLQRALAINPDAKPEFRLANLIMQRRAKWLLSRTDELFLRAGPAQPKP
jgi:predicted anti-sigma-YlaC factor YlaD